MRKHEKHYIEISDDEYLTLKKLRIHSICSIFLSLLDILIPFCFIADMFAIRELKKLKTKKHKKAFYVFFSIGWFTWIGSVISIINTVKITLLMKKIKKGLENNINI